MTAPTCGHAGPADQFARQTAALYGTVQPVFHKLLHHCGIAPRSATCRPRIHDLRHSFAVSTIADDYRTDDPGSRLAILSTYLGHADPGDTYWYLSAAPELLAWQAKGSSATWRATHECAGHDPAGVLHRPPHPPAPGQPEHGSGLSRYVAAAPGLRVGSRGKAPGKLDIDDLDAPLIGAFLDHLEQERQNGVRTRNARLAAIRSLFRYAALRHPEHAATIERVLAIPPKRFERRLVTWLTEAEIDALLAAPDRATWTGRRDTALFGLAVQTGLRASELIGLTCADVHLGAGAHVSCTGKGRKQRITPLTSGTVAVMRAWLAERAGQPADPLCPTRTGRALSRDAVERRLAGYVKDATARCPSLARKRVTMHVLRHSAAMRLLQAGIDTSVIALWLGHEQIETTQIYLHADLQIKERALERTAPITTKPGRFRPTDKLLAFLEAL